MVLCILHVGGDTHDNPHASAYTFYWSIQDWFEHSMHSKSIELLGIHNGVLGWEDICYEGIPTISDYDLMINILMPSRINPFV